MENNKPTPFLKRVHDLEKKVAELEKQIKTIRRAL